MNTKHLLYIIAIAEEGNLSKAGRKLGISQPTLSTFLSNLEGELGVDLFLRDKKQLLLTPAGKIYMDAARQILLVKDQTYQTIRHLTHTPTETITVGATPLRGSIMIAQIFPRFSKRFPDVKLDIREAYMQELRSLVRQGTVTYSLGSCYDTEVPDLDYIIVSREEVVLGVPAFHQMASLASDSHERLASIRIEDFADSPFVLLSSGTTVRSISDNIFSKAGFTPTIVFETNNNLVLSNLICQGAGAGLLPRSSMVADDNRVVYFSLTPRYYINLAIIMAKNRALTEAERYFAYLVIKQDMANPIYVPATNAHARTILQEFDEKEIL